MEKNFLWGAVLILPVAIFGVHKWKSEKASANPAPEQWQNWATPDSPTPVPTPPVVPSAQPKTYAEALQIAKTTNKSVVVVFGADWCGYCTKLNSTIASTDVQSKLNKYVYIHVNVDKDPSIAKKYKVSGIPAYVIIRGDESVVKSGSGFKTPNEFLKWLD